jgi:hypothetical protein
MYGLGRQPRCRNLLGGGRNVEEFLAVEMRRRSRTTGADISLGPNIQQLRISGERAAAAICFVDEPFDEMLTREFRQRDVAQPYATEQAVYIEGIVAPYSRYQADTALIEPKPSAGQRVQAAPADLSSPGTRGRRHDVIDGNLSDDDEVGSGLRGQKILPVRSAQALGTIANDALGD